MMVEQARALKRATGKPTKVQYTGVQVLAQSTNDLYYKSSRDRALAIAEAMNEDILEVDAMGVDFIQLDEFTWPYFYEDWAIEAFNRAVEGVQNAKIIVHVCWGNWGGTPAYFPDETAQAGEIFDLTKRVGEAPAATGDGGPEVLRGQHRRAQPRELWPALRRPLRPRRAQESPDAGQRHVLGGRHRRQVDDHRDGRAGGRPHQPAAGVHPAERLGVTTDCGLILLQRYIAIDKLHALVAGTELVRQKLG